MKSKEKQLEELIDLSGTLNSGLQEASGTEILPLSFFNRSYDILKQIASLLHSLEKEQLEAMQMAVNVHQETVTEVMTSKRAEHSVGEKIQKEDTEHLYEMKPSKITAEEIKISSDIHPLKDTIEKKMLSDLKKAISLNDLFLFRRELFGGDAQKMDRTIDILSSMSSLEDVISHLEENFQWNWEDEVAADFRSLLQKIYV